VPGITAAVAAAGSARISLTDRRCADQVLLVSAHQAAGKIKADWRRLICLRTTPVIYMPGQHTNVAEGLIGAGLSGQTPCMVISKVSLPEEQSYKTTLEALSYSPLLPAPSLLVVGETVAAGQLTDLQPVHPASQATQTGT
jgi:uroporphyrin-III C-methyltransferase